jgi:predicted metal-binding membrane protein
MTSTASAEVLSQRTFVGTSALLFTVSAALTIRVCASMSAMGEMPMPGGWSMSMTWMRMPGQTWFGAAASFIGMWIVMTLAMMLPSLVATLWRCRDRLTALVAIGYFVVWTGVGLVAFPLGVMVTTIAMQQPALARAVPSAIGLIVLVAGAFQFSERKVRYLECCRKASEPIGALPMNVRGAVGRGIRLGLHCCYCTAGYTAILLVAGVMDLRAMALVTAAISAERLAPSARRVSRALGALLAAAGLFLVARAGWLG